MANVHRWLAFMQICFKDLLAPAWGQASTEWLSLPSHLYAYNLYHTIREVSIFDELHV